jgi:hypothetical protein
VETAGACAEQPLSRTRRVPAYVGSDKAYSFEIRGGRVWIDHAHCDLGASTIAIEHAQGLLDHDDGGRPVLAVPPEDVAGKDSELIALEIECHRAGRPVVFVDLELPGFDEALGAP